MRLLENIWNVPNVLTMLRIALIGVFIWLFAAGKDMWALGIFLLAGFTDFLDGYIARRHQLITNFGKLMDPLADKLMLMTALVCLMADRRVPPWVVAVVAVKELVMVVGGIALLRRGIVVHARPVGKVATAAFVAAVVLAFFHSRVFPADFVMMCLAVLLSVGAMVWYIADAVRRFE